MMSDGRAGQDARDALPRVTTGPVDGPPAVMLAGLGDGVAPVADPDVARLLGPPPGLEAFRVHHLGYPRDLSPRTTTGDLAARVADAIDDLSPGRPVVLGGHSLGAMVALEVAARRPAVASLLVVSCAPLQLEGDQRSRLLAWDAMVQDGDVRGFERAALGVAFGGIQLARRTRALDALPGRPAGASTAEGAARCHAALTHAALAHDGRVTVPLVDLPTLVLGGGRDPLARPAQVRALAQLLPHGEPHVLPHVAHGLPEAAPRRVGQIVRSFVHRHGGDGTRPARGAA